MEKKGGLKMDQRYNIIANVFITPVTADEAMAACIARRRRQMQLCMRLLV